MLPRSTPLLLVLLAVSQNDVIGFQATSLTTSKAISSCTKPQALQQRQLLPQDLAAFQEIARSREPYCYRSSSTSLCTSESGSEESSNFENTTAELRPEILKQSYQLTTIAYASVGILHVMKKGLNFWSLYYVIGGPFFSGWLAWILRAEIRTEEDQETTSSLQTGLDNDVCKRLQWCLLVQGLMGISLPILDPSHFVSPSFVLPPLLAIWTAGIGYVYGGVLGWKPTRHICAVFTDIQENGWPSTKKTLTSFGSASFDYSLMMVVVGLMTLVKGQECLGLAWNLFFGDNASNGYAPLALASRLSRLARLVVFSGVVGTLKDLAQDNQLSSRIGVQLNSATSLVFVSLTGYLWSPLFRTGMAATKAWSSLGLGLASLLFSGITAYNALSARGSTNVDNGTQ